MVRSLIKTISRLTAPLSNFIIDNGLPMSEGNIVYKENFRNL
jgi:hypothetical protein